MSYAYVRHNPTTHLVAVEVIFNIRKFALALDILVPRDERQQASTTLWLVAERWGHPVQALASAFYKVGPVQEALERVAIADWLPRVEAALKRSVGGFVVHDITTAYSVLYVTSEAPPEVIRAAYRALVKLHHPDKGGEEERFKKIQAAYESLRLEPED